MNPTAIGVIPARYAASRLPGKPLAIIAGKPMIQHVYERAVRAERLQRVVVATDDSRIVDAVQAFGGTVLMTRADHPSGSDRVAEVAVQFDADFIVNIQGDEPFISPHAIDQAVAGLAASPWAQVGTLVTRFASADELRSPNTAKVVLGAGGRALYFSRAPIPFLRDEPESESWLLHHRYYKHIGLYVFRRAYLLEFVTLSVSPLERAEKLEQLRILEHGDAIVCAQTTYASFCVDTPEDLERAQQMSREEAIDQ